MAGAAEVQRLQSAEASCLKVMGSSASWWSDLPLLRIKAKPLGTRIPQSSRLDSRRDQGSLK